VVEDVRPGVEDDAQRGFVSLEIRDEHFEAARRDPRARLGNRPREMRRAEIREVVAIDGRDDDVAEFEGVDGARHLDRLLLVRRARRAVRDVAVAAGPGAGAAQDHERRRPVVPALADVGAVCLFADGVEAESLHQPLEPVVVLRPWGAHLQPLGFGLAGQGMITVGPLPAAPDKI